LQRIKALAKKAEKKTATKDERTGYRKPSNYLKAWGDPSWTKQLTPRLSVPMVDEEIPISLDRRDESRRLRKSWYLGLTQPPSVAETLGPVRGLPTDGATVVLFEDDVVALVEHLFESMLVDIVDGRIVNGVVAEEELFEKEMAKRARAKTAKAKRASAKKRLR
jgi:hypothetical protein